MAKNPDSNNLEKTLLLVLSFISVGLLVAIIYVWYSALGNNSKGGTKPGDFLKPEQNPSQNVAPAEASPSSQTQMTKNLGLNITSPAAEEVVSTKSVVVTGTSSPNASITVTGSKDDVIVMADADGIFSGSVNLNEGQNDLVITAFDSNGVQTTQVVSVVYIP